jgi:hypothetical protein
MRLSDSDSLWSLLTYAFWKGVLFRFNCIIINLIDYKTWFEFVNILHSDLHYWTSQYDGVVN